MKKIKSLFNIKLGCLAVVLIIYGFLLYSAPAIFNPIPRLLAGSLTKWQIKKEFNQNMVVDSVDGDLATILNQGYIDVSGYIKDYPDVRCGGFLEAGTVSKLKISYKGSLFMYIVKRDFNTEIQREFGDKIHYKVEWHYPEESDDFNNYVDSEKIAKDIAEVRLSDFDSAIEGCDIYLYANTYDGEYVFDNESIYEFVCFYRECFTNDNGKIILRLKSKDNTYSEEIELPFNEINSADDVVI